jgi:hypothetical protein
MKTFFGGFETGLDGYNKRLFFHSFEAPGRFVCNNIHKIVFGRENSCTFAAVFQIIMD